jgi:uncharacterized protein (DUF1684 family)
VSAPANPFTLADWRHTVAEHYAAVRALAGSDAPAAAAQFRAARARLMREHPDSPIVPARRATWDGPRWFRYDATFRVRGEIDATAPRETFEISLASDGMLRCTRVGLARFSLAGRESALAMYWLEGYGGGLWLPFSDASAGSETHGGTLSLRHDQGRRPRHCRHRDRARLQLRLQPVGAPTTTAGRVRCRHRRTACRTR